MVVGWESLGGIGRFWPRKLARIDAERVGWRGEWHWPGEWAWGASRSGGVTGLDGRERASTLKTVCSLVPEKE